MATEARVVSLQGILRQTWCANVAIGLQSPKWNLQKALIYLLCQGDMFCFPLVLVCPSGCYTIRSHHWFDRGQRRQRKTLCASTWCECSFVYVRVRQGVVCVLFFLSTVLRQISDCFKWARQFQSVEMYVIAILWMSWTCEFYLVGMYRLLLVRFIRLFCAFGSW